MLMRLTLAAPKDSVAGRWDYTMRVWVRTHSGAEIEIGRFITPYGRWFRDPWSHTWTMDVTPYQYLLRDTVTIRVQYDGYSQGSVFSLAVDCHAGEPVLPVYKIDSLWQGVFSYGNVQLPLSSTVSLKKVLIDRDAKRVYLRVFTTGHGGGGTDNAAEFSDKTHHIAINDVVRFTQHLWRTDCGENPLYPQAGTWYYSRAGWCPGDVVHPWYFDLTPYVHPGDSTKIDYQFEPFINKDSSHPASYIVSADLLYAAEPTFTYDAAFESILMPSDKPEQAHHNPICSEQSPKIVIRNNGKLPLKSLRIDYGIDGRRNDHFDWHGSLEFLDTAQISLPPTDLGIGTRLFTVLLADPNGHYDENPGNNLGTTTFTTPPMYDGPVRLSLLTDKVPAEDSISNSIIYDLIDATGRALYSNGGFADSSFIRDTFDLAPGCYQFVIQDTGMSQGGGDGLFPIYPGSSRGFYALEDVGHTLIDSATASNHKANFGPKRIVPFTIREGILPIFSYPKLHLKLDQKKRKVEIDCSKLPYFGSRALRLEIVDALGKVVESQRLSEKMMPLIKLDLSPLSKGKYYARVDCPIFRAVEGFTIGR